MVLSMEALRTSRNRIVDVGYFPPNTPPGEQIY
jgi:hypothetical protein